MDEVVIKDRKRKRIIFSPKHFWEEVMNEKLFSSLQKAGKMAARAIKSFGILVEPVFERHDCHFFCIFLSDVGKLVCCPIISKKNHVLFVPTIYAANAWQAHAYKEIKKKRAQARLQNQD